VRRVRYQQAVTTSYVQKDASCSSCSEDTGIGLSGFLLPVNAVMTWLLIKRRAMTRTL
jgi:hypothetical protein